MTYDQDHYIWHYCLTLHIKVFGSSGDPLAIHLHHYSPEDSQSLFYHCMSYWTATESLMVIFLILWQNHNKRAMMALNRSSEFKSSNPKTQKGFLVPEVTIWANSEELNYAIHYTKFQASEPSGSEREDFFHIAYVFLCFKLRNPWHKAILDPQTLIWTNLVKDHNTHSSIPIYPLQRVFYPQNLACTPKNGEPPKCFYTLRIQK